MPSPALPIPPFPRARGMTLQPDYTGALIWTETICTATSGVAVMSVIVFQPPCFGVYLVQPQVRVGAGCVWMMVGKRGHTALAHRQPEARRARHQPPPPRPRPGFKAPRALSYDFEGCP